MSIERENQHVPCFLNMFVVSLAHVLGNIPHKTLNIETNNCRIKFCEKGVDLGSQVEKQQFGGLDCGI